MVGVTLVQDSSTGKTCPVPFVFKDQPIRTVVVDEQPWFVAKDVSKALGIGWTGATLKPIPDEWKGMLSLNTPRGKQRMATIAEPAVYKLAFRSNKPEADVFTNWVASEVLPAIRKTGQYAAKVQPTGPLTPEQCRHLHDVMDAKVCTRPNTSRRAAYSEAWTRFNRHFRIAKYNQLPQGKYAEALSYIINMDLKAGQKALPGTSTTATTRRFKMPSASEIQGLVENIVFRGSEMHKAMDDLWDALWPNQVRFDGNGGHFVSMSQLRFVSEDIFKTLSCNVEACRRMANTVSVNYSELCQLRADRV